MFTLKSGNVLRRTTAADDLMTRLNEFTGDCKPESSGDAGNDDPLVFGMHLSVIS